MALGSLVVHLAANTAGFSSDLGKAAHLAEQRMKNIADAAEKTGKILSTMFAAGIAAGIYFTRQAIDNADAMQEMAQAAGISTESLSALGYAASLSGISTESLSTSLSRLNRNIAETAAGSGEARKAFIALGIDVKNADGTLKNADQVMSEVAQKFSRMEDGAGKSALAIELFGRAGAQMIPLLNQGAAGLAAMRMEAEQLGQIISTETAMAADHFNDNVIALLAAKRGLANAIMTELLPALNAMTDAMLEGTKQSDALSTSAKIARTVFEALAILGSDVAFTFRMVGGEIGVIAAQVAALVRGDFKGFKLISEEWTKDAAQARADLDAFQARILGLTPQIENFRDNWEATGNMFKTAAPQMVNKEALNEQIASIRGFIDQYEAAIKTNLALLKEAEAQGQVTRMEGIRATAAMEDARLQVIAQGFMREAELYTKQGELAKARQAELKAQAAEAARIANEAISGAQVTTLEQVEQEKAAARADAFNRELAQSVAAIELQTMTEYELREKQLEERQAQLDRALAFGMITEEEYHRLREELELQHQAKMGDFWAEAELKRRKFAQMSNRQLIQEGASMMMQLTSTAATQSKKWFEIHKIASLANAIVKGIEAVQSAYAWGSSWGGPAGGAAMAAIAAAATGANIQAIRSTQFGGGGAVGTFAASPATGLPEGGAFGGGAGRTAGQTTVIKLEGDMFSRDQLRQLVEKLNENTEDGGRLVLA